MSVTGWNGVTLTAEIALSAATSTYGIWDAAIWNTSTWGPDVVWTDVTDYVRSIRTSRAFSRGVQSWGAGSAAVVLDNRDARFSPANLSGPYVSAGVTQVRPLRPLRIRATYSGINYSLWCGYVQSWTEGWSGGATNKGDALTKVDASDEWSRLAAVDGYEVAAVGAGELSGARVHRVLNAAGHTGDRSIETGSATLQATTLEQDALAELEDVVKAEGGALYVSAAGVLVFEGQYALINNTRSVTSQASFSDDGTVNRYVTSEVAYDSDMVVNWAVREREGGTAQSVYDNTSRALYGDRRSNETGLICDSDAQALTLAQWVVQQYKDPELRFTRLIVSPRRDPANLWPQALGREVRDQITVGRNPPGGISITRACHIAGVSHDITPDSWITTWDLSSAEPYVTYASSRWNSATWDSSLWFF